MTSRHITAACLLVSMLGTWSPATAQPSANQSDQWRAVVSRLEPAAFVAVRLKDGTHLKGTVVAVQETTFTIQVRTRIPVAPRSIDYADVMRLERARTDMNSASKLLIGVGVGVGATLATLALLAASWGGN